jgi:hypothetical protein
LILIINYRKIASFDTDGVSILYLFTPEANEQKRKSDNDDSAEDGIVFRDRLLEEDLQGFPGAAAMIGKKMVF